MTSDTRYAALSRVASSSGGRIALFGLLLAGLALAASSDEIHAFLVRLATLLGDIVVTRPVLGVVCFVAFSAAAAMLAFVSSGVLVPVALLAWGPYGTFGLLWLGWVLGGVVAYGSSRWLGRRLALAVSTGETIGYLDRLSARAPFRLILLFQLGLPSEIPGLVLGLLRYPFAAYVLALCLAELPYAIVTVSMGSSFLQRRVAVLLMLGLGALAFSTLAFSMLHRSLSK